MQPDAILQLADRAVRSVRKRHGLDWTREDWQDARQEAAAGIVRALRDGPQRAGEGYYFNAGVQGATRFAFRKPPMPARPLFDEDCSSTDDRCNLFDGDLSALRAALSGTGRKDGARGGPKTRDQSAVARDMLIIEMLRDGCTRSTIAARLGTTKDNVDGYISMLRRRLARLI